MKSIPVISFICLTLCSACAATGGPPLQAGEARLVFDGHMKSSDGVFFAVSLKKPDESLVARAWMAIGHRFSGYEIVSFEGHTETLLVRNAGGETQTLKLPANRVVDGSATTAHLSDGFMRAMDKVHQFVHRLRTAWNEPIEFKLDTEGDAMPDSVRTRFVALREREEAESGYLIGVSIDQEWHFSRFSGQAASSVIRESLSDAQRRTIEVAWAFAHAEAAARAIARKKRGDPMPALGLNDGRRSP